MDDSPKMAPKMAQGGAKELDVPDKSDTQTTAPMGEPATSDWSGNVKLPVVVFFQESTDSD